MTFDPEQMQTIDAVRVAEDLPARAIDHEVWTHAPKVKLDRYWSGELAPAARSAEVSIVWSDEALCVRFVCRQGEELVISSNPLTDSKTIGLWDRDVCEIFIAPDPRRLEEYFEFEAAPTGEWLDLGIRVTRSGERETDWEFNSGLTTFADVSANGVTIAIRVPFASLLDRSGRKLAPQVGERWRVNLFRCVGEGEDRGYLAWQPTCTPQPNFHVPEKFGWVRFT